MLHLVLFDSYIHTLNLFIFSDSLWLQTNGAAPQAVEGGNGSSETWAQNEEDFKMAALSEESYSLWNILLFAFNVALYNNYHLYIFCQFNFG